jgi:hypothetical protein
MYFNLPSNKFSYRFIIDIVLSEEHPSIIKYSIFRYFCSIQTQWCQKLFFWIIWCCNYCDLVKRRARKTHKDTGQLSLSR